MTGIVNSISQILSKTGVTVAKQVSEELYEQIYEQEKEIKRCRIKA